VCFKRLQKKSDAFRLFRIKILPLPSNFSIK
jgi:hypothetical protein